MQASGGPNYAAIGGEKKTLGGDFGKKTEY